MVYNGPFIGGILYFGGGIGGLCNVLIAGTRGEYTTAGIWLVVAVASWSVAAKMEYTC